jgi:signal transduction histidine kinase
MEDITALLVETTRSIREISSDIRPPLLDHCGLVPALEDYISKFVSHTGIQIEFSGGGSLNIDAELETSLFRIVQEALTNCAKHSRAKTIKITLRKPADKVVLSIIDDGYGFLPETLFESGSKPGLGILSMRERAEFLGGTFRLTSTQGKGTKILVEFKLTRAQRQAAWTKRQHDRRQAGGTDSV